MTLMMKLFIHLLRNKIKKIHKKWRNLLKKNLKNKKRKNQTMKKLKKSQLKKSQLKMINKKIQLLK
jgi:hypothetical protein